MKRNPSLTIKSDKAVLPFVIVAKALIVKFSHKESFIIPCELCLYIYITGVNSSCNILRNHNADIILSDFLIFNEWFVISSWLSRSFTPFFVMNFIITRCEFSTLFANAFLRKTLWAVDKFQSIAFWIQSILETYHLLLPYRMSEMCFTDLMVRDPMWRITKLITATD